MSLTTGVEPPAESSEMVVLGKIVVPYGLAGAVKVHPFADDPQAWAKLPQWWLGKEGDAPSAWRPEKLRRCKLREGVLVAEFSAITDRNASEAITGMLVGVPRDVLPPTKENEYYWADLIGLDVVNTHGELLGQVLGLIETPGNDVLRVGQSAGDDKSPERLLPFVAAVVLDVDLSARQVRVDWEIDW